jgi:hypothetical protein
MKLYTVVMHYLQMCMKEYGCCPKFGRGDEHTSRGRHKVFNKVGLFKTNTYYNCVKFNLNPMSRLGGVALTSPSLHTKRISEYKLNYLPFQILDSNHIPSCTSAGSALQLCKVS